MQCTECGTRLRVTETRDNGAEVYRSRMCDNCQWVVTTREAVVEGEVPKSFFKPRDWAAEYARRKQRRETP